MIKNPFQLGCWVLSVIWFAMDFLWMVIVNKQDIPGAFIAVTLYAFIMVWLSSKMPDAVGTGHRPMPQKPTHIVSDEVHDRPQDKAQR